MKLKDRSSGLIWKLDCKCLWIERVQVGDSDEFANSVKGSEFFFSGIKNDF